ncbi:hypothetical protein NG754_10840 [Aliarcobacter cryaerophilus]|jgi:uncharacterized protein YwqG|uniref:hypothetical protein n=1 Tax=Aliarcobacter cryaerophilus TaxID=28198 RepID=UPI003DA35C0E
MLSSISTNQTNSTIISSNENKIESTQGSSFKLALEESSNIEEIQEISKAPSQEALLNFYEIHQRSQITGVPTNEYNNAVKALGIDINDTNFHSKAVELLSQNQFSTDFPSQDAVLKYGNTQQEHGNRAYMIGNEKYETGVMFEKATQNTYNEFVEELREEILVNNALNKTSNTTQTINSQDSINSIIPQEIVYKEEYSNIDTTQLISTLQLLLSKPNVVNNDVQSSIQNTLDFLNSLDNQTD